MSDFEHAVYQNGVFMSKEELRKAKFIYSGVDKNTINYQRMSTDLGLHSNNLNFL